MAPTVLKLDGTSDVERIEKVIRLLNLALADCRRLLAEVGQIDTGHSVQYSTVGTECSPSEVPKLS